MAHETGEFSKSFFSNFIHCLLSIFISDKFNMSLAINFEIAPSTAKPVLTVFKGRMFSLLSKSMSQIFSLFSMTFA